MSTLDQISELINLLYTSPTAQVTRDADSRLKVWQSSPGAWDTALVGLTQAQSDAAKYFFAQTIRSKIQVDFFQLSQSIASIDATSLKNKLIQVTFSGTFNSPTTTQLLLSLCDLAVQLAETWTNSLQELLSAAGSARSSTRNILELLKLLPEELENERLVVDEAKREICRRRWQDMFEDVHGFLQNHVATSQAEEVLPCLLGWMRLAVPTEQRLITSPLLEQTVRAMPSEAALDVVMEILEAQRQQGSLYPRLVKDVIMPALGRLQTSLPDEEELLTVVRVFTLAVGSSNNGESSYGEGDIVLMQKLLGIVAERFEGETGLEITCTILDMFQDVAMDFRAEETPGGGVKAVLASLLDALMRRLTSGFQAEEAATGGEDSEVFVFEKKIRSEALTTARAVIRSLGVDEVGDKLLGAFGSAFGAALNAPTNTAGPIFIACSIGSVLVEAIDAGFAIHQDSVLSEVANVLIRVVTNYGNQRLRVTCIRLLSVLAADLDRIPGLMSSTLSALCQLCLTGQGLTATEELETALAVKAIVKSHRDSAAEYLPGLTAVVKGQKLRSGAAQTVLVEAVVVALNEVRDDEEFKRRLSEVLEPLVATTATLGGSNTKHILDQITTICRSLRLHPRGTPAGMGATSRVQFFAASVAPVLWQSLSISLSTGRVAKDEDTVEKTCRVIKHLIRVDLEALQFLVPQIASKVLEEFRLNPGVSSYLYVAEILVDAYGEAPASRQMLTALFDSMAQLGLTAVAEASAEEAELLIEDLFGMGSRFLRRASHLVLQSQVFGRMVENAVAALPKVHRRETFEAVTGFLQEVWGVAASAAGAAAATATLAAVIKVVVEGAGEDLLVMLPDVITGIRKGAVAGGYSFESLLSEVLQRELPEGVLTTAREKDEVVAVLADGGSRVVRRLLELGRRANQRLRR